MIKVEALTSFRDLERKKQVEKGTCFSCSEERASYLVKIGFVKVAEKSSTKKKTVKSKE